MEAKIGIEQKSIEKSVQELSKILADEYVLYTRTRNAHWNVEGPDFYRNHKFFEEQYDQLDEIIDEVAERIRSLGHYAPASLGIFLKLTHLSETTRQPNDGRGLMNQLLQDQESIIIELRKKIKPVIEEYHDEGTGDFITSLMEQHEKMAWMLRAHLK